MKEEIIVYHDIIKNAFIKIHESILMSQLHDNEKNALSLLIERLIAYYDKKMELMIKKGIDINHNERAILLKSFMTDVLADINSVIKGGIDVYYFVSVINKRLNDKEVEKFVKNKK